MSNIFQFEETFSENFRNSLPDSILNLDVHLCPLTVLVRLLLGDIKILQIHDEQYTSSEINYFNTSNVKFNESDWEEKFSNLFGEDMDFESVERFISHSVTQQSNKGFYFDLINECSSYIVHINNNNQTAAFIHLYRLLEYISYAFPLAYSSSTDDYKQTHTVLSDWFRKKGELSGELKFFQTFVKKIYERDAVLDTMIEFDIPIFLDERAFISEALKETIIKAVPIEKSTIRRLPYDPLDNSDVRIEENKVSVNYANIPSMIINLRNKFVHNLNGTADNYKTSEYVDSEILFKIVNQKCMSWISILLLEVTRQRLSYFLSSQQ